MIGYKWVYVLVATSLFFSFVCAILIILLKEICCVFASFTFTLVAMLAGAVANTLKSQEERIAYLERFVSSQRTVQ